jgi:CheY-like chemotaxis protein
VVLKDLDLTDIPILIVNDNATNRLVIREMTAGWGFKPSEALSGEEGLAKLYTAYEKGNPFRVILLDMHMPYMDGFEVAAKIKERPYSKNLQIIVLTSAGERGDVAHCKEIGVSGSYRCDDGPCHEG